LYNFSRNSGFGLVVVFWQALDWLSSHYWDVQQQALQDAQTLLRLKLVQHSEMVHKGLQQPPPTPEQLPLVSEEREKGEKQSRKELKKKSKEALRCKAAAAHQQ
jgi:hypothetical protein